MLVRFTVVPWCIRFVPIEARFALVPHLKYRVPMKDTGLESARPLSHDNGLPLGRADTRKRQRHGAAEEVATRTHEVSARSWAEDLMFQEVVLNCSAQGKIEKMNWDSGGSPIL